MIIYHILQLFIREWVSLIADFGLPISVILIHNPQTVACKLNPVSCKQHLVESNYDFL